MCFGCMQEWNEWMFNDQWQSKGGGVRGSGGSFTGAAILSWNRGAHTYLAPGSNTPYSTTINDTPAQK